MKVLNIPASYLAADLSLSYWKGRLSVPNEALTLVSNFADMSSLRRGIISGRRFNDYLKHLSPVVNHPDMIIIELLNNDRAYKKIAKSYKPAVSHGDATQRIFLLDDMVPEDKYDLKMSSTGNYLVGEPVLESYKGTIIFCQHSCAMIKSTKSAFMMRVHFHRQKLSDWKYLYDETQKLIAGFAVNNVNQ